MTEQKSDLIFIFNFIFTFVFIFICMDIIPAWIFVYHRHIVQSRMVGHLGLEFIDGWELPCRCQELWLEFLEEQPVLLITEIFLQPPKNRYKLPFKNLPQPDFVNLRDRSHAESAKSHELKTKVNLGKCHQHTILFGTDISKGLGLKLQSIGRNNPDVLPKLVCKAVKFP